MGSNRALTAEFDRSDRYFASAPWASIGTEKGPCSWPHVSDTMIFPTQEEIHMSEAALKRIEKGIANLATQQEAICERLIALEGRVATAAGGSAATHDEVIQLLDGFRAGEALGAASICAWIEVCTTDCVRGALRTIHQREAMHAVLLEERMRALGAEPKVEIPTAEVEKAMKSLGSTEQTDAQKLLDFAERTPDADLLLKPIYDMADRLDHDQETQWLLRSIAQDEQSTVALIHEACALLNPQAA